MYHCVRQVLAFSLIAHTVRGAVPVELDSGKFLTVDDEKSVTPAIDSEPGDPVIGGITPRDLFGRHYCSAPGQNIICGSGCCSYTKYCCEQTTCIDASSRICCPGSHQCYKGGQCCSDGNCCDPGKYCVKDLTTGQRGCLPYSNNGGASSIPAAATTSPPALISPPSPTSTRSMSATGIFTCNDAGYAPCPGQRFCCPTNNYCFYDSTNAPKCWQDIHYTFYYSYSWSYSFGIRWFTATTTYYLNGPTVLAISTPPPRSTAPQITASETTPSPPSTVALSTATSAASALPGGLAGSAASNGPGSSSRSSTGTTSQTTASSTRSSTTLTTSAAVFTGGATSVAREVVMAGWVQRFALLVVVTVLVLTVL
ncbi:MAG: hypothetical protein M1830_005232 [Pleopsidium flavum]|nr:MAG: hypothetical protein M1830_005232 [Pleopsidium flavum]